MYLKASGLGLQVSADPAAEDSMVSGLLNNESLFISETSHLKS